MTSQQDRQRPPPDKYAKLIEKLKKLFSLANSANQHEAEAALGMANRLMTEHQIALADIDFSDSGSVTREDMELDGGRQSTWLASLAGNAAMLYDAQAFYYSGRSGPNLQLLFVGTPPDIAAAKMTFTYLHRSWQSIVKLDQQEYRPRNVRTFRRSHGIGFNAAIHKRVKELVEERQRNVRSATGRDLVVVKDAAVKEFLEDLNIKSRKPTGDNDKTGLYAGYQRGKEIPLHGAIEEEDKPLMLESRNR